MSVERVRSSWEVTAAAQTLSMLGGASVDQALLHPRPVSQSSEEGGSPRPGRCWEGHQQGGVLWCLRS